MRELFDLFPVPGRPRHAQAILAVWTNQGDSIHEHQHPEWTLVYYVTVGDPVCAIWVEGERVEPAPGEAILLPPMVKHRVERSASPEPRLSIALRWEHDSRLGDDRETPAREGFSRR